MGRFEHDLYSRITELVSLLSNYEWDATIRGISKLTGTALEQTREDIAALHRYGLTVAPGEIAEKLSRYESRYDDTVLSLSADLPEYAAYSPYLLFLDPTERELFSRRELRTLRIKHTPTSVTDEVRERMEKVRAAIREGCGVRFRYFSPVAGVSQVETIPRMIYHNTTDDLWYLVAFPDEEQTFTYRFDRIRFGVSLDRTQKAGPLPEGDTRLERLQYAWGADFSKDAEISHVRVRIEANTANLLEKIRAAIRERPHATLTKEGKYWIYEDDVIGLSSFRAWLMSFGSSVKVLEPAFLAEELRKSSADRLENYRRGEIGKR